MAARNAIVKRLRSEGDRALASEVAGLRRPSWTDWALDTAAVEHADIAAAFADAAADMRDAQQAAASGRSGVDLGGSIAELRERSAALVRVANEVLEAHGRPAALPDLTERLAAVAANASASERLRAALLGPVDDDAHGAGNGFGSTGDGVAEPRTRPPKVRQRAGPKQEPHAEDRDHSKQRAAERRRLERDVKELERTLSSTERQIARADTAVRHAQSAVDAATEKLAEATAALQHAEQRAADTTNERDELSRLAEQTAAELEQARRALDSLGG